MAGAPRRPTRRLARRATPAGVGAVLVAITVFSLINLIVKVSHASAPVFAFYRLWLGAGAMVVASLVTGRTRWRRLGVTVLPGALFGLNILLFFSALKRTGIADVLIIAALQPALTLLVAGPLFGERVAPVDVGWTLLSVGGIVAVTVGASGNPVWSLTGDIYAFGALIAFTVYFLISKRVRRSLSALEYMTGVTATAAVLVTPVTLLSGRPLGLRTTDWLWLLLFVAGAQGGHIVLAWAHPHVDVSVSSLLILAEPVISAVAALLVLGEPLAPLEVFGGLVVIAGMAVVVRRATRGAAERVAPPEPSPA